MVRVSRDDVYNTNLYGIYSEQQELMLLYGKLQDKYLQRTSPRDRK